MIKLGRLLFIAIMTCMIASSCSDDDIDVKITPINVPQVPLNIEDTKKEELFLVDNEAELNQVFAGHTKELPQIDFKNFKLFFQCCLFVFQYLLFRFKFLNLPRLKSQGSRSITPTS